MADYQARINLLVAGQDSLSRIQRQVEDLEGAITAVERRWRTASAALTRSRTVLGVTGTDLPRGAGGRFAQDPDRQQRINALAAQRQAAVQERIARLTASRTRQEIDNVNTRLAAQERLNRRVENQIALESRLNAAVDLYRTNLRKFERGGSGRQDPALVRNAEAIQEAFAAFEAGGSRNLRLVRSLATELGRVGEAQRELNRAQSLGSKGFEAGRRLQERLSVVAQAGTTSPERVRAARSMATEAISASRSGDQQAYTEAIRRATAATSRLERESRETATALQAQQVEVARAAAATAQLRAAESAASVAARGKLAAAAQARQERATFLAGAPVSQFPVGPAQASTRRRFSGDTSVERAEGALRTKELQTQRALNVKFFAEEKAQVLELDRLRAASAQKQTQRIQGIGKAVQGSLSSAAIGGAFPLLFGQSPQAAVGGAIGGLLGGAGGGFAGSLLGTALGELEAAKARTKELTLELGLSSTQAKTLATAFELAGRNSQQLEAAVTNIQGLGLSTKETASAIKIAVELSKEYGGSVEKIAQAFADTLESGKVSVSTLNKFTAQGIPIQDQLAEKLGVSRTKLLEMAKDGKISVQQVTDVLVDMGQEAEKTADKGKTGFDRFVKAVEGIATAIASAAGALLKTLVPALDTVLTKLSNIITRATQAINLLTDAQVGEATAALGRSGFSRGTFSANKGNIDDLKQGLQSLQPLSAKTKEQFDRIADVAQRYRVELSQYGGALGEYAVSTAQVELTRVQKDLAAARKAVGAPARPDAITGINAPANLPPAGAAASNSAAEEEAKRLAEQIRKQTKAAESLKIQQQGSLAILRSSNDFEKAFVEFSVKRTEIQRRYSELTLASKSDEERKLLTEARALEFKQSSFELQKQIADLTKQATAPLDDIVSKLKDQVAFEREYGELIKNGTNPELAKQIIEINRAYEASAAALVPALAAAQAAVTRAEAEGASATEIQKYREELERIQEIQSGLPAKKTDAIGAATELAKPKTDQQNITEKIATLKKEITDLTSISNIAITSAEGIGNAFATSFKGLVDGSMTAKEALGSFFKSVADMFLEMAAQIIAKQITMIILQTILKALGAVGGIQSAGSSAGSAAFGGSGPTFNPGAFSMPQLAGRAAGGPVTSQQPYMVGERGPELFVPGTGGSVVNNSDLRSAMNGGGGGGGSPVLNMSFQSTSINGVEYVSRDQLESAMAETRRNATRDGAKRGMAMTLDRIQNSSSTRRKVGI